MVLCIDAFSRSSFWTVSFIQLEIKLSRIFSSAVNINPIALRKAKIAYNFGLSECNKVKDIL